MIYFIAFIIALTISVVVLLPILRRREETPTPVSIDPRAATLKELCAERDNLYQTIKELEFDLKAGNLSEKDYQELRRTYQARAVEVLRRIDELKGRADEKAEEAGLPAPSREGGQAGEAVGPAPRSFLIPMGALLLIGLIISSYMLAGYDRIRTATLRSSTWEEFMANLERRVERNPSDIDALLTLARASMEGNRIPQAIEAYKRVLALDANNVEALVGIGFILISAGHFDPALSFIDKALSNNPVYPPALLAKGLVLFHGKGDYKGAIEALERYIMLNPRATDQMAVRGLIEEARAKLKSSRP